MSDRLTCPDCDGKGEQMLGPVRVVCQFCGGLGYVGDDNEPAEDRDPPPAFRPVWEHPAVSTLTVCPRCFGARTVVNLGGTGEPHGKLIEMPCPACGRG